MKRVLAEEVYGRQVQGMTADAAPGVLKYLCPVNNSFNAQFRMAGRENKKHTGICKAP